MTSTEIERINAKLERFGVRGIIILPSPLNAVQSVVREHTEHLKGR